MRRQVAHVQIYSPAAGGTVVVGGSIDIIVQLFSPGNYR